MSAAFVAAAFIVAVCLAPAARAFTIQNSSDPGAGQGYLDVDKPTAADRNAPVNRFGSENGMTTFRSGNSTFQFGSQPSFDRRYSTDNLFNPYMREGRF
jgi:hypothetical protein